MNQPVTREVTEGKPDSIQLGFQARAVIVDNYSQSWAWIPAARRFARPFVYGAVFPLDGSTTADILWQTPPALTAPPVGSGALTAQWLDIAVPPSEGVSVFAAQTQNVSLLGPITDQVGHKINLPQGVVSVAIRGNGVSAFSATLTGVQTSEMYWTGNVPSVPGSNGNDFSTGSILLNPLDTQLTFQKQDGGTGESAWIIGYQSVVPGITTVSGLATGTPITELPGAPLLANVLGGSGASVVAGITLITIPTGRTWKGTVGIAPNASGVTYIKTAGAATPPAGTIVAEMSVSAAGGLTPAVVPDVYVVASGVLPNTASLVATSNVNNIADAWANGLLL